MTICKQCAEEAASHVEARGKQYADKWAALEGHEGKAYAWDALQHAIAILALPTGDTVSVPREPTETALNSVRGILQILRGQPGATYAAVRDHCELRGDNIALWPAWALEQKGYVTEAGAALLLFQVMSNAMLSASGAEQQNDEPASAPSPVPEAVTKEEWRALALAQQTVIESMKLTAPSPFAASGNGGQGFPDHIDAKGNAHWIDERCQSAAPAAWPCVIENSGNKRCEKQCASCALSTSLNQGLPVAPGPMPEVFGMVVEVIRAAYHALDDSEERDGIYLLDADSVKTLSEALDALETLPNEPGYVDSPGNNAQYALRQWAIAADARYQAERDARLEVERTLDVIHAKINGNYILDSHSESSGL